jgi:hypothetical protein
MLDILILGQKYCHIIMTCHADADIIVQQVSVHFFISNVANGIHHVYRGAGICISQHLRASDVLDNCDYDLLDIIDLYMSVQNIFLV